MAHKSNHFRIIGGKWRRRLLPTPSHVAVRPTLNRIRETLFNWLMHEIQDAVCLDAFAGSGALGFEALSRGARHVYFIEKEANVITLLQAHVQVLACKNATLIQAPIVDALAMLKQPLDLVFIDPPFHQGLVQPTLAALLTGKLLSAHASIYVETERSLPLTEIIDQSWQVAKSGKAGQVAYYLLRPAPFSQYGTHAAK